MVGCLLPAPYRNVGGFKTLACTRKGPDVSTFIPNWRT